jgi:hypothetical protein
VEGGEQEAGRGRIAIAVGAAVLLAAVVGAVVVAGSGGDDDGAPPGPPPPECLRAWNGDRAATAFGRHNFNFHRYEGALVTYLNEAAEEVASADDGLCAVVFPSQVLDPEPIAAGQVLRRRVWTPISELAGVELTRVGELQVAAAAGPNARLDTTGELSDL